MLSSLTLSYTDSLGLHLIIFFSIKDHRSILHRQAQIALNMDPSEASEGEDPASLAATATETTVDPASPTVDSKVTIEEPESVVLNDQVVSGSIAPNKNKHRHLFSANKVTAECRNFRSK